MKPYRKNASVIACKNGKFLLVKKPREHHAWQFPQGGVEAGETFEEAACREFEEELGTKNIKILREAGVHFYDWPDNIELDSRLRKFRGQEVHLFLADFTGTDAEIKLDENELEDWKWVNVAELRQLIESPCYLKKIQAIIQCTLIQKAAPEHSP